MFGKVSKKDTIISGGCVLDSGLNTTGNLKVFGKINGNVKVEGNITIGETGVILGEVTANDVILSGTVEGSIHCKSNLKLTSSAKLSGDAYVKHFSSEEGCLFGGKCVMEGLEARVEKSKEIDKNFDMTTPKSEKKATIISELESTENIEIKK